MVCVCESVCVCEPHSRHLGHSLKISGLVAGDSAICGRLAALILRLWLAGLQFFGDTGGLGLRFSNRSELRPVAIWMCGMSAERNCPRKILKPIQKTVWKTRKRIRKTIRNAFEKLLAPLRPLQNISPALFNKFLTFFTAQNLHKKKFFFHREALQGGPR